MSIETKPNVLWIDSTLRPEYTDDRGLQKIVNFFRTEWPGLILLNDPDTLFSDLRNRMQDRQYDVAVVGMSMFLPQSELTPEEIIITEEGYEAGLVVAKRLRNIERDLNREPVGLILTRELPLELVILKRREFVQELNIGDISYGSRRHSTIVLERMIDDAFRERRLKISHSFV